MTPTLAGAFVKSSASGQQDNCVEVAPLPDDGKAVRDSKNRRGATLFFTSSEWYAFVECVKGEKF
ncbi:DUF397 domain-containing protein [Streptomyces sp. NPDC003077]|uniref:DUF397 domain-containing protein n=1 Tax=Streptomyces sp. NPDC003077 TaxID=3154443 RepID=UPI0033BCAE5E